MQTQSLAGLYLNKKGDTLSQNAILIGGGAILLSLLAQLSIPLPFTPVPLTGQTFGVALLSLLLGARRGAATVVLYLALGTIGLPVFSLGKSGLAWGPTLGYLLGMPPAALWVGFLADRGHTKGFWGAWLCATSGSLIVFASGLSVLSFFLPAAALLKSGLWPFLPGDLLKNCLAAGGAFACRRYSAL